MLLAAAVVPTPPLLVPEIAAGSAARDEDLRAAALAAEDAVLATGPDRVVVVGEATSTGHLAGQPDWHPFGVPLPRPRPASGLPLAHGIGAWLLGQRGCAVPIEHLGVAPDTSPLECAELGRRLSGEDSRTALLACGDGSARRNEKAPGHFSPAAAGVDATVAAALAAGDATPLLELGVEDARELWIAGRTAWQVLAGAAGSDRWDAEVSYSGAPYGVHYVVATWLRRRNR